MKFNKIILFVCLFALINYSIARKITKRLPFANPIEAARNEILQIQGDYDLDFYRNDYYKICLKLTNDYHLLSSNNDCLQSFMQTKIIYNCSEKDFDKLKSDKKFDGASNVILYSKDLPFDTMLEVMQKTSCVNPVASLDKKYTVSTLTRSEIRVRFSTSFFPNYLGLSKQFYEVGEYVASVNPIGKGLDMEFFIQQLNLSEKLRARSVANNPAEIPNSLIELQADGDLKIEKAALYVDKIIPDVYHEIMYICVRNVERNKAYHFIVDRAARDPTHEKDVWNAIKGAFDGSMMATLVRVNYYSHSATCDEDQTPDNVKFNPKFGLALVGKEASKNLKELNDYFNNDRRAAKFRPAKPLLDTVNANGHSFKKLITAIQRYALRYPTYNVYDNCQHFATGFFNYFTSQSEDYINVDLMKRVGSEKSNLLRTSKDPFDHFFTEEDDNTFIIENSKRIKANNRRRFK